MYLRSVVGDRDLVPNFNNQSSAQNLRKWLNGKPFSIPFTLLMIWRETRKHLKLALILILFHYDNNPLDMKKYTKC